MLRRLTPLLLFAGSAATGLTPVADGDVFWHLAAGREMVRTGSVLVSDPFSSGALGRPWVDVHWLFQLGVYAIHAWGGLAALVAAKCLLIGASTLVLYAALQRRARPQYLPIAIAALFCARHLLLVRPVIVSLLLLALFFLLLERFRREGRGSWLLLLPLLQIAWSNCQGLAAFGPALIGAYATATAVELMLGRYTWYPFAPEGGARQGGRGLPSRLRALLLAGAACAACSLATPFGTRALALPAALLARLVPHGGNPYAQIAENVPPFALERELPGQFWHLPWFLGLLALSFALSRRVLLSHALLVVGFVVLALMANRNVLLLYFMAAPIAAGMLVPPLARLTYGLRRYRARPVLLVATGSALLGLLLAVASAAARETRLDQVTPFHFPQQSVERLATHGGSGTVFAADHQGGYLIWRLYPNFKPYIDTRLVLRTPEEYDEYLELAEHPYLFDAFANRERISHVVLPVAYPDRYLRLIAQLYQSVEWKLVFTNGSEVLFSRRDQAAASEPDCDLDLDATTDRLLAGASARFAHDARLREGARLQIATLQIAVGAYRQAQRTLTRASSPAALALGARGAFAAGELERATALAERLLSKDEHDARGLALRAQLYLSRGQSAQAVAALGRALAEDPFDREATDLLAALEEVPQHDL